MNRIRSLELVFNLEKNNLKSKEDCVVIVFHCLLINEGFQCVGIGDEWPTEISVTTELLPKEWNSNQSVYSLRYISKDLKSRILLKATNMEHILQADVVKNENDVSSMSVPVENYVDNYNEYSTAYKDLSIFRDRFNNVMQKLQSEQSPARPSKKVQTPPTSSVPPAPPLRSPADLRQERNPYGNFPRFLPRVGGRDLDPLGGEGGMFMDPSSFGVPARPSLPQFGVGGPSGLPRGAVPPGARFDPFMPPIGPNRFQPDPDHYRPPDYDDQFM